MSAILQQSETMEGFGKGCWLALHRRICIMESGLGMCTQEISNG